jgi:hypothetical protein
VLSWLIATTDSRRLDGLLLGALRQPLAAFGHLGAGHVDTCGAVADLADQVRQALVHAVDGAADAGQLVSAGQLQLGAQVTAGHRLGGLLQCADRSHEGCVQRREQVQRQRQPGTDHRERQHQPLPGLRDAGVDRRRQLRGGVGVQLLQSHHQISAAGVQGGGGHFQRVAAEGVAQQGRERLGSGLCSRPGHQWTVTGALQRGHAGLA